ncbi:uncharacterized protein C1orf54 homolog isoform X3 [Peromyscus maniculatus bairdii]|uniref:uncharacterized protein C1orf54 homolog isoform X3 n=1 Tax=Peromyscus maniculatus bairdii TaxID=230844 RepID=UPI003FCF0921
MNCLLEVGKLEFPLDLTDFYQRQCRRKFGSQTMRRCTTQDGCPLRSLPCGTPHPGCWSPGLGAEWRSGRWSRETKGKATPSPVEEEEAGGGRSPKERPCSRLSSGFCHRHHKAEQKSEDRNTRMKKSWKRVITIKWHIIITQLPLIMMTLV